MSVRIASAFGVICFVGASVALGFGFYALGVWFAACVAATAYATFRLETAKTPVKVIDIDTTLGDVLKRLESLSDAQRTVAAAVQAGIQPRRTGNGFMPFGQNSGG